MNKGKLIITRYNGNLVSLLTDSEGRTVEINAGSDDRKSIAGNIYAGNVTDIVKNINGAFVDIGKDQKGFLHPGEHAEPIFLNRRRDAGPLRQGDMILVRAVGDPVKTKDPHVSMKLSIPGKYAVLIPQSAGLRFSSKITDSGFKEEMTDIFGGRAYQGVGFIIRTAAEDAETSLIVKDMEWLNLEWQAALERAGKQRNGLVWQVPEFYIADMIENASSISEIVSDDPGCIRNIRDFLEAHYPEDLDKLKTWNPLRSELKTVYEIGRRMDEALKKRVSLKSGGYLIIEPTEALTAIDVNSGSAERADFRRINQEAAREAARQIQLRNLSGIIIIDFINMKSEEDNSFIMKCMEEYLSDDPLRARVADMTKLGLLEITRKKVRCPLYEIIYI